MTLDLARIGSTPSLAPAAPARDDASPPAPAPHAEKITLSAEGRAAGREAGPVPSGTVRWYRAARGTRGAAPPSPAPARRAMHVGVAAYRRSMMVAAGA